MIEPRIVIALVNSVWQSAILVLFTASSLSLLGRMNANRRYAIWVAALAICAILPAIDFHLAPTASIAVQTVTPVALGTHVEGNAAPLIQQDPVTSVGSIAVVSDTHAWQSRFQQSFDLWVSTLTRLAYGSSAWLFWLWIGVADLLMVRLALQLIALARTKRRVQILEAYDWIGQRPGVRRQYSVGTSSDVDVPCLLGLGEPVIAIPGALARELTPDDVRRIVQHESAHVRRFDDWFNLIEQVALALLFFNPVLYYVTRAIHLEREIACDDHVVAPEERLSYAECLSEIAGRTRGRTTSFVPTFFRGRRDLIVRIERLLDRKHSSDARLGLVPFAMASLTVAFALALAQTGIPVIAAPAPSPTVSPLVETPSSPTAAPQPAASASASPPAKVRVIEVQESTVRSTTKQPTSSAHPATHTMSKNFVIINTDCSTSGNVKVQHASAGAALSIDDGPPGTIVLPAPICGSSSHNGSKTPQVRAEQMINVKIVCPHSMPQLHAFPPDQTDLKTLKAAGCTVSHVAPEMNKVFVRPLPPIDMKAMELDINRSMAVLHQSMGPIWVQRNLNMPIFGAMKALAEAQGALIMPQMPHSVAWMPLAKMDAMYMANPDMSLPPLPVKEITDMREHGVTASYIASLSLLGYAGLPAADYVRLHDHNVTPESVEALRRSHPDETLSVDDLIRLQGTH